jgi:hypothetical protein
VRRRHWRSPAIAVASASFGSFFDAFVAPSSRTLADNVGGTSDDVLASSEQLLGEQLAEPVSGLQRPPAVIAQRRRPRQQPLPLRPPGSDLQPADRSLVTIDRHRCVGRLVRVYAEDHRHGVPPHKRG